MDDTSGELTLENAPSKRRLRTQIERLNISADAKAILNDVLEVAVDVGGQVISAGRQIIAFILDLVQKFPNTAFGLIVAMVISSLISSIPFLGAVLGPLMAPLLIAFGLAAGAVADLRDAPLRSRVATLEQHFLLMTQSD